VSETKKHETEFFGSLEWLKTLPLFIELPVLNLVHVCWHKEIIFFLKTKLLHGLSNLMLEDYYSEKGNVKNMLDTLIIGPKIVLPENVFIMTMMFKTCLK
jgi:hypothetical protein